MNNIAKIIKSNKAYLIFMLAVLLNEFVFPLMEGDFFKHKLSDISEDERRPFHVAFFILVYTLQPYFVSLLSNLSFKLEKVMSYVNYRRFIKIFYLSSALNLINYLTTALCKEYLATKAIGVKDVEIDRLTFTMDILIDFFVILLDEMTIPFIEFFGFIFLLLFLVKVGILAKNLAIGLSILGIPNLISVGLSYLGLFNYEIDLPLGLSDIGPIAKYLALFVVIYVSLISKKKRELFKV